MNVSIRLLQKHEISIADSIFRLAFGTFVGSSKPAEFFGDRNYIETRFNIDPRAAFVAEVDGQIVGSNIAANWGSVGTFGPLTVHPDYWDRDIAKKLIEAAIAKFSEWDIKQAGLFTFPGSPKHQTLYHKFEFYPRFLTFVMGKIIESDSLPDVEFVRYSELDENGRSRSLKDCYNLTDSIYPELDASREILSIYKQNLGEIILFYDNIGLAAFAACHCGAGSEAGADRCYIKFAAVRPGTHAADNFERLLTRCEAYAKTQNLSRLVAGVNTSHAEAYTRMISRGFRTETTGVAMHKPNEPAYHISDIFVLDDWR